MEMYSFVVLLLFQCSLSFQLHFWCDFYYLFSCLDAVVILILMIVIAICHFFRLFVAVYQQQPSEQMLKQSPLGVCLCGDGSDGDKNGVQQEKDIARVEHYWESELHFVIYKKAFTQNNFETAKRPSEIEREKRAL